MKTILNKYFPEDIGNIIYDFLRKSCIKDRIETRLVLIEDILNNYIDKYQRHVYYDINIDYYTMNLLDQKIMKIQNNYINKQLYSFDERFITIFKKYRNTLFRIMVTQTYDIYSYSNPLSMGKFDALLENIDIILKFVK